MCDQVLYKTAKQQFYEDLCDLFVNQYEIPTSLIFHFYIIESNCGALRDTGKQAHWLTVNSSKYGNFARLARKLRNCLEHHLPIDSNLLTELYNEIVEIRNYNSLTRNLFNEYHEILDKDYEDLYGDKRCPCCGDVVSKIEVEKIEMSLLEINSDKELRNTIKGKNCLIKSGKYEGSTLMFLKWNGNNTKFLKRNPDGLNEKVHISINVIVEFEILHYYK